MGSPADLSANSPGTNAAAGAGQIQAGGFISGLGGLMKGFAGFGAARYQAQVAKINAAIAAKNADYSIIKGESEAMRYGIQASQRFGNIRAAQGSSGLDVNSGSAQDVQASQRMVTSLDFQQIRENAARQAYNYKVEEAGYSNQARLDTMQSYQSLLSGGIDAASSFIGSSSSAANKWLYGSQAGLTPANKAPVLPSPASGSGNLMVGGVPSSQYLGE